MKKLMLLIGLVAGVSSLQAASVNWKLQLNGAEVGNTAYAVLASALEGKDMAKLTEADITGNALTWVNANTGATSAGNTLVSKSGKATGTYATLRDDALTAGTAASIYLIVLDGDGKYAVINNAPYTASAAQVYADGQTGSNVSAGTTTALTYTPLQPGTTPGTPEPTSGILMLVGFGALALRRRRA